MPTKENPANSTAMKRQMYAFLADLVPDAMRGKELNRMASNMGTISLFNTEYEHVWITELLIGTDPFSHDNTITVTFKNGDCQSPGRPVATWAPGRRAFTSSVRPMRQQPVHLGRQAVAFENFQRAGAVAELVANHPLLVDQEDLRQVEGLHPQIRKGRLAAIENDRVSHLMLGDELRHLGLVVRRIGHRQYAHPVAILLVQVFQNVRPAAGSAGRWSA